MGCSSTPSSLERPPPSTRRARRWKASGCSIPSGTGSFYSRPLDLGVDRSAGTARSGLITKKGYIFFSGYKFIRDPRGFDILPDATHGSSGFLTEQEMRGFLEVGPAAEVYGMDAGQGQAA